MVQKIKEERPSTDDDSGSDSDVPSTPLAASTQRSPLKAERHADSSSGSTSGDDDSEDYQPASQERIASPVDPERSGATMDKYFSKFPYVRPSKKKYCVDVDLTDPDDEVWIVRCPASVDAKKLLLGAKFEECRFGHAGKIKSMLKGQPPMEGFAVENTSRKPVVVLSGNEFKSFIPEGTIQIRDVLKSKQEAAPIPEDEDDSVPYPENLRDRHPLLGLDYKTDLKLPKKVKKSLSLAQQRSEACYLQQEEKTVKEPKSSSSSPSKKKRKRKASDHSGDEMIPVEQIKQEVDVVPSPARKKVKKEKKVKGEPAVEDDLSWLHNI
uniref:(northern house mosquito) hypothetical protein n=1 Tax=Culex pipiens TaxID=7175 RepID=A0A8D8MT82_CULPI